MPRTGGALSVHAAFYGRYLIDHERWQGHFAGLKSAKHERERDDAGNQLLSCGVGLRIGDGGPGC